MPQREGTHATLQFLIRVGYGLRCASVGNQETPMSRRDESAGLRRREFLRVAGGIATTLGVTSDARGQNARPNAAAPPDRGLWATRYDLPVEGREPI